MACAPPLSPVCDCLSLSSDPLHPPSSQVMSSVESSIQPYVDAMGSYATSPVPAYSLAGLCE